MNPMKDNICYKKILRWFKIRKKRDHSNRRIYFRRSLFYLRPIRLWLCKITVRYSNSPRSSLRRRTRSTGQRCYQAIKKNRQGLLRSQIPKEDTQWNQSIEGSHHSSSYQDNRKTGLPNKNQLQGISWPLKKQYPYRRLLPDVLKKRPLTAHPPCIEMILLLIFIDIKQSYILISLTSEIPFIDLLVSVVRESNLSNLMIAMRSKKQKIIVDDPIMIVTNKRVKRVQKLQLKNNKSKRTSGQKNNTLNRTSSQNDNEISKETKIEKDWSINFNWDEEWDPSWDPNEGGMHGRFSSVMAWDSYYWGNYDDDFSDKTGHNNGERETKEEEIYTLSNSWDLSSALSNLLKFNPEKILSKYTVEVLEAVFKIYKIAHKDSNNHPKSLEALDGKNMLDWPWSRDACDYVDNEARNLQNQTLHVDSSNPPIESGRSDRQSPLNQLIQIECGTHNVSDGHWHQLGKSTPSDMMSHHRHLSGSSQLITVS